MSMKNNEKQGIIYITFTKFPFTKAAFCDKII